jgi:hypothetical protein
MCDWCGEEDRSVGKDPLNLDSCFTCTHIRENLALMARTEKGWEFISDVMAEAKLNSHR